MITLLIVLLNHYTHKASHSLACAMPGAAGYASTTLRSADAPARPRGGFCGDAQSGHPLSFSETKKNIAPCGEGLLA